MHPEFQEYNNYGSHQGKIKETESFRKTLKTRKDHNNRLKEMLIWKSYKYSEYFIIVTVLLSDDQQKDKDKCRNNKYDFIQNSLNI